MIHRPARAAFRPRDGQPEPSSSSGHDRRSYTTAWGTIREISGTLLPYEVIPTLKLTSEIRHITEFAGHRRLYTAVFLLVMNKGVYASLDADLRRALDAHSGTVIAAGWGRIWDDFEEIGRDNFAAAGGVVTFVKNE